MAGKRLKLAAALFVSAAYLAVPTGAWAQDRQVFQFDLAPQDLGSALRSVTATAHWELYAAANDVNKVSAPRLLGRFTAREAIAELLRGTSLIAQFDNGSVIIRRKDDRTTAPPEAIDEPIVVTGTRIQGTSPVTPVVVVSSEDIKNAGQSDLGEVARSLPQNFGGGQNPGIGNSQGAGNENANANGASTFNLRGIGPNATLTLLNGNRLSYTGVNSVIDVSAIPVVAVDHVEIVADGASAIYGADAVAGVVNILLKRDYSGISTSARLGASTDGGNFQQQYNLLGGAKWSGGGFLATYDYFSNTEIKAQDRTYAAASNPDSFLYPALRRHSLLFSGHQTLGTGISFSADLIYKTGSMDGATGYLADQPVTSRGLKSRTEFETFGISPTLSVDLPGNWTARITGFYGTDDTDGLTQIYSAGAIARTSARHFLNRNLAIEAGVQGSLFTLPGGDVRLAFGGGLRSNRFKSETSSLAFARKRQNRFAYGEIHLPLVSPTQDIRFVHRAALTGALRFEDNSDSASIVTPKLGLLYEPVEDVRLGVSWGKSFKLPSLYQQYSGYVALLFPVTGFGEGYPAGSNLIYALGPDNRLRAERSENWTLSATVTPVAGLEVSGSYFHIDYKDRVAPPLASGAGVLDNPIYAQLVTFDPSADFLADIISGATGGLQNATSGPYDPAKVVAFLDARDRNIAEQRYSGVDVSVRYSTPLRDGNTLTFTAAGTWIDSRQRLLPGLPATDLAGTIFQSPDFRARGGMTFGNARFTLASFVTYSGGVLDNRRATSVKLSSLTTLDLTGRLRIGQNTEVSLSALNILNAKPDSIFTTSPFDTPYDTTNYSPTGRFIGLTLTRDW